MTIATAAVVLTTLSLSMPGLAGQAPAPGPSPADPGVMTMSPERRPIPTRNVKVDVTITDQTGSGTPMKKVVSLVVADGRSGNVRSHSSVPLFTGGPNRELPLNVDATALVTPEQRVLLELKFNYSSVIVKAPGGAGSRPAPVSDVEKARDRELSAPRPTVANITENLWVLLSPGVSTVVARSADAAADRIVTVEVKADIVK